VDTFLNPYVYPLFALFNPATPGQRLIYAGVTNGTAVYASGEDPCVVICLTCAGVRQKWVENQRVGGRASVLRDVVVFGPSGSESNDWTGSAPAYERNLTSLMARMERDRADIRSVNLNEVWTLVAAARRAWPEKKSDLEARRDEIREIVRREEDLWEASGQARSRAETNEASESDITLILTVAEALRTFDSELPQKYDELKELIRHLRDDSKSAAASARGTSSPSARHNTVDF
jgi:hypothetical protein